MSVALLAVVIGSPSYTKLMEAGVSGRRRGGVTIFAGTLCSIGGSIRGGLKDSSCVSWCVSCGGCAACCVEVC